MTPLARRLVATFALLGLAASLTSLYVHYRLLTTTDHASFCDVTATVSCTQAYLSRYGSFLGVPVALPGAIWFSFAILLVGLEKYGPAPLRDVLPTYLFLASTLAMPVILYLGYAAFFVLHVVCLLCLTTYAAVIGLFVVTGLASPLPMTKLPSRLPADLRTLARRPVALALVLLFLGAAGLAVGLFPSEARLRAAGRQTPPGQAGPPAAQALTDQFTAWWQGQPRITLPVSSAGAAVVIVKFTDIQCGLCGSTHFALKPVLAKYEAQYPGAVRYIVKDYPLQAECNSSITRPFHLAACDAAVAVRLARRTAGQSRWRTGSTGTRPLSPR